MKNHLEREAPQLDMKVAEQILMNVFEADGRQPSQVPLEVLTQYALYRKDKYGFQKSLVLAVMLVFVILPMFFFTPTLSISKISDDSERIPVYSLNVDSFLPVSRVHAEIDGRNTAVYSTGEHLYEVEPFQNGELKVTVTLWNKQSASLSLTVDDIDTKTPYVVGNRTENGYLYLEIADDDSGVNFDTIYSLTAEGFKDEPVSCDPETGTVVFTIPKQPVNIFIDDFKGNTLQLVISIRE